MGLYVVNIGNMRNKTLPKLWDQIHKNNSFKLLATYAELGEIITININMCEGGRSIQSGQNTLCVFFCETLNSISPRRYPYFDVVVGLVWPHDPKSYAGGSVCYW
jgi:hypothetical protein